MSRELRPGEDVRENVQGEMSVSPYTISYVQNVTRNLPLDYAIVIVSLSSELKPKTLLFDLFLSG